MSTAALPVFKGLIKSLLLTHNTLLSILYAIIMSNDSRYIRCCDHGGKVINKGAQFRDGLDSQYGDVVFIMKNDFWKGLKGVRNHNYTVIDYPLAGHVHKHDFVDYSTPGNINLIDRWLEHDARLYDFRRPVEPGTKLGNGRECLHHEWPFSWCNLQFHVGENVGFEHVEKVYAPAWIVHDSATVAKIANHGVNTTMLRLLVTNQLTHYPGGDNAPNLLNGLFHLYGPSKANDHYFLITKERHKIDEDTVSHATYESIEPTTAGQQQTVPTYRHASHSSSTVFLDERTFHDLEIRYMADLIEHNMTMYTPDIATLVRSQVLYQYNQTYTSANL